MKNVKTVNVYNLTNQNNMNHSSTLTQPEPQLHNNRLGQAQNGVGFFNSHLHPSPSLSVIN